MLLLLICLVTLVWGEDQVPVQDGSSPGKCPQLNVVQNFDINKYVSGVWYQVYYHCRERHFQQLHCPEVRLQYRTEGERIIIDKYYLNESLPVRLSATKEHIVEHPGSFRFSQQDRDLHSEWYYQAESRVVLTDYDNYAVIWACRDIEGSDRHNQLAIVSSRQRSLAPKYYDQITAYFIQQDLSVKFQAFSWDDCRARCPVAQ